MVMGKYNKHIIIVGSARSGTSWLSEIIARQFRYRMLFEPEHEFNTPKGILVADQWLKSETDSPGAHRYLKNVFANRVDNDWIAQISNRKFKRHLWPFIPKKYIIKFVRANLSAKYMNESFQIPLLHIIRNPYEVLESQQRLKFPWLFNLNHFKNQPDLVALVREKFDFNIAKTDTCDNLELLTIRWCLENILPLQVFEPYQYKHRIVRHEELRKDLNVFLGICEEFNLKPMENIESEYARPSSKTFSGSALLNPDKQKHKFASEEMEQINRILNIFKCELYPIKD